MEWPGLSPSHGARDGKQYIGVEFISPKRPFWAHAVPDSQAQEPLAPAAWLPSKGLPRNPERPNFPLPVLFLARFCGLVIPRFVR